MKTAARKITLSAEKEKELMIELSNSRMSQGAYMTIMGIGVVDFANKIQNMQEFEEKLDGQYVEWLEKAPDWVKQEWYSNFGKPSSIKGKYDDFWFRSYGHLITVADVDRYLGEGHTGFGWRIAAEEPFAILMKVILNGEMSDKDRQTRVFWNACIDYIKEAEKNMRFYLPKVGVN